MCVISNLYAAGNIKLTDKDIKLIMSMIMLDNKSEIQLSACRRVYIYDFPGTSNDDFIISRKPLSDKQIDNLFDYESGEVYLDVIYHDGDEEYEEYLDKLYDAQKQIEKLEKEIREIKYSFDRETIWPAKCPW